MTNLYQFGFNFIPSANTKKKKETSLDTLQ
jgi:hypothetical protein